MTVILRDDLCFVWKMNLFLNFVSEKNCRNFKVKQLYEALSIHFRHFSQKLPWFSHLSFIVGVDQFIIGFHYEADRSNFSNKWERKDFSGRVQRISSCWLSKILNFDLPHSDYIFKKSLSSFNFVSLYQRVKFLVCKTLSLTHLIYLDSIVPVFVVILVELDKSETSRLVYI